jgi:AraC-like DNA-binding protein
MVFKRLSGHKHINEHELIPHYTDHYLITGTLADSFECPEHLTGLGIITFLKGKGKFKINGVNVLIDENSFLVVNSGSRLSFRVKGHPAEVVFLYFNPLLASLVSSTFFSRVPLNDCSAGDFGDFSLVEHIHYTNVTLSNYLTQLIHLGNSCASFQALKADMLIRTLLDELVAERYSAMKVSSNLPVVKTSTQVDLYKRLQVAKAWMEKEYTRPLTIDEIAGVAMINSEHFLRLFKRAFGITPHQHLIAIRIERAKGLLRHNTDSIASVCGQIGFESLSSFSALFKHRVGISPGRFRIRDRQNVPGSLEQNCQF